MITQEYLKSILDYDPETGVFRWKVGKALRVCTGVQAGTVTNSGYRQIGIDGKVYQEHRLAFIYMRGYAPPYVDHINRNPLDNSWSNLRGVDAAGNARNSRPQKGGTSKYKGVSWSKYKNRWVVYIRASGCRYRIGYFKCEHDAATAYNFAAYRYHGEFAYYNLAEIYENRTPPAQLEDDGGSCPLSLSHSLWGLPNPSTNTNTPH